MTAFNYRNFSSAALKWAGIAFVLLSVLANTLRGKAFGIGPLQMAVIAVGIGLCALGIVLDTGRVPATLRTAALVFLPITPFLAWTALQYITIDLWYDEVYTLNFFVFRTFQDTLTDLHSTNNHIFLNVINFIYLRLWGIQDMMALLDRPIVLRLLMLAYALVTCVYVYRAAARYFNRSTALAALLLLATTLPFFNFGVQVRGYSLSMMLLSMLVFYAWRFEESGGWKNGLLVTLLAALLLYTMPSNIYTAASLGAFYLAAGLLRSTRGGRNTRALRLSALLVLSAGVAFVLYLPVFGQLLHNPNSYIGLFNRYILYPLMPQVLWAFISGRYLIIVLAVAGLVLRVLRQRDQKARQPVFEDQNAGGHVLFLIVLLAAPFLLAFVHGYIAFDRVFVLLAPVFALAAAVSLAPFYAWLPGLRFNEALCLGILAVYCYATFAWALQERDAHVRADIEQGSVSQDLYYNYFQADYAPSGILRTFRREQWANNVPVLVYDYGDTQSVPVYLEKVGIAYDKISAPAKMLAYGTMRAHIITAFPNRFLADTARDLQQVRCRRLNPNLSFINVFECEW